MTEFGRVKKALLSRLDDALTNMYHNATPSYPNDVEEGDHFDEWLSDVGQREIEYIQDGLGVLPETWKKYKRMGFPPQERYYWLVGRITEWGKLYQWGRGGRTLAPEDLVKTGGGSSFRVKDSDYFEDMSNADLTDMIQVVEAFNKYVETWNKGIPEMWKEEKEERKTDEDRRLEMIDKLVEEIDDWDEDQIMDTLKHLRRQALESLSYGEVEQEFNHAGLTKN